MTDSRYGSYK